MNRFTFPSSKLAAGLVLAASLAAAPALAQQVVDPAPVIVDPEPVVVQPGNVVVDPVPVVVDPAPRLVDPPTVYVSPAPAATTLYLPPDPATVSVTTSMPVVRASDYLIDFTSLDANHDALLTRSEVALGTQCRCTPTARANLLREFHVADRNDDGLLAAWEMNDWLK